MKGAANTKLPSHLDESAAVTISRSLWGNGSVRGTQGTGDNEWYSPAHIISDARKVLGEIDLDPASSDQAQTTVQALRHFTQADDGLKQAWLGTVWLNPPYAQPHIEHFADKLIEEVTAHQSAQHWVALWFQISTSIQNMWPRSRLRSDAVCRQSF